MRLLTQPAAYLTSAGLRERLKLRTLRYSVYGRLVRVICQARRRRLGDRGLLPADGQTTDSDASVVDDGDGPDVEVCFQSGQVGEEDHYLFVRSAAGASPVEDHRGHGGVLGGEKAAEVGVGRDQHPVLVSRSCQDLVVAGPRQAVVGRMHRVVSRRHEAFREAGRQALVDEEPQAGSSRGTRRSCSAAAA